TRCPAAVSARPPGRSHGCPRARQAGRPPRRASRRSAAAAGMPRSGRPRLTRPPPPAAAAYHSPRSSHLPWFFYLELTYTKFDGVNSGSQMQLSEAADQLGVHYQTAYAWVRRGELPATKHGWTYQVLDADVAAFAASRSRPRDPEPRVRVRDWPALAG